MSFIQKAKEFAKANPQKVDQAVEKVGDLVDKKTGGKYVAAVDKVQETVKTQLKK
ncbi:antitoxin [Corynebacterium sp.]|uniref:antitoxin n=1 Tax=Corynebacterium sp. TaxID=1720 RepID=UPI0026DC299A|nr:antitoxin [Corynebacterium sp.]MDO5077683.1 antitoxin [Corynebacterium sp.]